MNILYKEDSTGVTDWQQSVGRPLRTAGCLLFLCTAGRAVVSVNMQKKPLRCGSLLVVTQDMFAMPEAVSVDFAARYVSLSDATLWTAYYRIPDTSLWGILFFLARSVSGTASCTTRCRLVLACSLSAYRH